MGTKELATAFVPCGRTPLLTRSVARRLGSSGQAFMELALGMLALALVLSALFGFTAYILSSLRMQCDIRAEAGRGALNSFVVPCFTNVRLVPLDSVGGEDLATADYGWVTHVRKHLPFYLEHGPMNAQGCFYCLQLQTWEKKYFRDGGIRWLKYYAGTCIRGTGGGGSHGGTSHGH